MGLENPSRRHFLKAALVSAGALAAEEVTRRALRTSIDKAIVADRIPPRPEAPAAREVSFLEYKADPRPYETGELAGKKFSDLLSDYTGISGIVPKVVMIDFKYQLAQMWKKKIAHAEAHGVDTGPLMETAQRLFSSYEPAQATKVDLTGYMHAIDGALSEVRLHDLGAIRRLHAFKDLDDTQLAIATRLEASIDAQKLLAYSITELMPSYDRDSPTNIEVLKFLLENAGSEYIDRIPALNDSSLSFGPDQFTENALEHRVEKHLKTVDGKPKEFTKIVRNGASLMDSILPTSQIPAHVAQLRGTDHHKAAYLFALYNIASLVKSIGPEKEGRSLKLLKHFEELPPGTVLEYIATAHHLPRNAIDAFLGFTDAYIKWKELQKDPAHLKHLKHQKDAHSLRKSDMQELEPQFKAYCKTNGLGVYYDKTKSNMSALHAFLDTPQGKNSVI